MQRKARIKLLRGDKSLVRTYVLEYGQPFYDTSTGQLYIGIDNNPTPTKQLQNTPTVFQDKDGNIKIGSDFSSQTNPKIVIDTINNIFLGTDIKKTSTDNNSQIKLGQEYIVANPQPTSSNFSDKTYYIMSGTSYIEATTFDNTIANNNGYYIECTYSLYIGKQKLYYYDNTLGYILGDNNISVINSNTLNISKIQGIGQDDLFCLNGSAIKKSNSLAVLGDTSRPIEEIVVNTTTVNSVLNVGTINLIV